MRASNAERAALARASDLAATGTRRVLGIAGPPGAGKSTLARRVVAELGEVAAYLPMDGFHLANTELARLERRDRKGAIDTFDGAGFLALLRRIRTETGTIYAPSFDRTLEDPLAGSIPIPATARLIVVEGNYLLVDREPWSRVPDLCDETWYAEMNEATRLSGLIARHVRFGMEPDASETWARDVDQHNADLVESSRARADLVVRVEIAASVVSDR